MKKRLLSLFTAFAMIAVFIPGIMAAEVPEYQSAARKMEYLDRGVVAVSTGSSVFVSWRLLATDDPDVGFNVYRTTDSVTKKLNSAPLYGGTNFTDTTADLSKDNSYFVKTVLNGVERDTDGEYTIEKGAAAQCIIIPIKQGGTIHFVWVGDFNGDGKYDYLVDRVWDEHQKLEAYLNDGTYLWTIDLGPGSENKDNISPGASTIDVGMWDGATVYDIDCDGYAEVLLRIADGVIFGDGTVYSNSTKNAQAIAVINGMDGSLETAAPVPDDYINVGPMACMMEIGYLDGKNPNLICWMKNRNKDKSFNSITVAYGFDESRTFKQIWKYDNKKGYAEAHQIRVADVDYDGRDEVLHMGYAINPDGTLRYKVDNVVHGDRWYVGSFSNDNNGNEMYGYGIQQENPNGLLEYFYNASTGKLIWEHYSASGTYDVARGNVGDIDPRYDGYECWSFQGLYSMDNQKISDSSLYPVIRLWWDGDLLSESYNDGKIEEWDYNNKSVSRLLTTWKIAGATGSDRGAPMFYGDILGDWREEVVMTSPDYSSLIVLTTTTPTDHRIYSLAQNPAYRNCMTGKGYYQSHMTDFFLGHNMETPDIPNISIIGESDSTAVESITFAEESVEVREGDAYKLKVTVYPEEAANQRLIWTSGDIGVAKVTNGLVTGIAPGTATITATTRDGSVSAQCQVTVVRVNVESLSLSEENISVKEGGSYLLTASVYPEDATRKGITWMSSNEGIAAVEGGRVFGKSTGTCTITATSEDGGHYAICRVTVLPVDEVDMLDNGIFEGADGKKDSASLDLVDAANGGEFYRDFIPFYKDTATLSFTFSTGGKQNSEGKWNWDGREYTFGLQFLDTFGGSILEISQGYKSGAQATMGAANGESADEIKARWAASGNVDAGGTNPMNRSTTTWLVTLEFNYDEDICTATIMNREQDTAYSKTFSLEGKSFKRLRYYAKADGSGPISVSPSLSNLSYTLSTADRGAALDILRVSGNAAEVRLVGSGEAALVGELYDGDGNIVDTKELAVDLPSVQEISFDHNIADYELKLSLWDGDTLLANGSLEPTGRPEIGTVTATDEPEPDDNPIKNAYDGNLNTVWASFGSQRITFELEEKGLLTDVKVAFAKYNDDRTIPFRIYSSADGASWRQVYSGTSVPGSGDFIDCAAMPVDAVRYVRVEVDGNSVSGWTSLAEVEIYTSEIPEEDEEEEPRPAALRIVTATASAEPQPENSIKNAYDGDLSTVWAAEKTQSITFDLGKEYKITGVSPAFKKYDDDRTIPFRVYVSDGRTETLVYSGSSVPYSGGFMDIEVSPNQEARYVRIEVDGAAGSRWTSLAEVQIYGFEIEEEEPEEKPSEPSVTLTGVRGATADVMLTGEGAALLIGALYGPDGTLEEVKSAAVENLPRATEITFDKDIAGHEIKLFMWNSKAGLVPLAPSFEAEIVKLDIASAVASSEPEPQNPAKNSYDGDLSTFWASEKEQNIVYDLGQEHTVMAVSVAFAKYDDDRTIPFKVSVSTDKVSWTEVYSGSSIPRSGDFMNFAAKGEAARYVKIDVSGNTRSHWTSLAEVEVYGIK
ncbi:MAG: discoidin domain-containing protein [Oscillospiraceae bacterium]|nr:discoidin domain-containing protein [Oscillospiraceae bacterium]